MGEPIHIAITLRVRKTRVAEFERALAGFREAVFGGARSEGGAVPLSTARLRVDRIWRHAKLRQRR
jgi:hypothetical protein